MGDLTLVAFGSLTVVAVSLLLTGALRRARLPIVAGAALLFALIGAWMLGPAGAALGALPLAFLWRGRGTGGTRSERKTMRSLRVLTAFVVYATVCSAQIPGTWVSEAGEMPEMRLVFKPGGELLFEVGFQFWNPARWAYDSAAGELRVTIPKLRQEEASTFEEEAAAGSIKRFDAKKKTITYQFSDSTFTLSFAGFVYSRRKNSP